MGTRKKVVVELVFNLQWRNKPDNGGDKSNVIGMYDTPATTSNFEMFKSYLLKNSGVAGNDVKVTYITDNGQEWVIDSQEWFEIALSAFRLKARLGEVIFLKLDKISNGRHQMTRKHSNDVETQFDRDLMDNGAVAPPEWFAAYMKQFKRDIVEEVTFSVTSNLTTNPREKETIAQPAVAYSRKLKPEPSKRSRKHLGLGETPIDKELIKTLKYDRKLENKLDKLDAKTKKIKDKKMALMTRIENDEHRYFGKISFAPTEEKPINILPRPKEQPKKENSDVSENKDDDVLLTQCSEIPVDVDGAPLLNANAANARSHHHMMGGEIYMHTWEIVNSGKLSWSPNTELRLTWGSAELVPSTKTLRCPILQPGGKGSISVRFEIPKKPGTYESYWNFYDKNVRFGHHLGCCIIVEEPLSMLSDDSLQEIKCEEPTLYPNLLKDFKTSPFQLTDPEPLVPPSKSVGSQASPESEIDPIDFQRKQKMADAIDVSNLEVRGDFIEAIQARQRQEREDRKQKARARDFFRQLLYKPEEIVAKDKPIAVRVPDDPETVLFYCPMKYRNANDFKKFINTTVEEHQQEERFSFNPHLDENLGRSNVVMLSPEQIMKKQTVNRDFFPPPTEDIASAPSEEAKYFFQPPDPKSVEVVSMSDKVMDLSQKIEGMKLTPASTVDSDSDWESVCSYEKGKQFGNLTTDYVGTNRYGISEKDLIVDLSVNPRSAKKDTESGEKVEDEKPTQVSEDKNNNNDGTLNNNSSEEHFPEVQSDASSDVSSGYDVLQVPVCEEKEDGSGYVYVTIDGNKLPVPKHILRPDFLAHAEEAPAPIFSEDERSLPPRVPSKESTPKNSSTEDLKPSQTPEEKAEKEQSIQDNISSVSHCSAIGSCFSDATTGRLFIFPHNHPGYEVVTTGSFGLEDSLQSSPCYTWAKSPTQYNFSDQSHMRNDPYGPLDHSQPTPPVERESFNYQPPPPPPNESIPINMCYYGPVRSGPYQQHQYVPNYQQAPKPSETPSAPPPQQRAPEQAAPPVHILPENLVTGAVNVASSAINTARSVINMIVPKAEPGRWVNGHWVTENPESLRAKNLVILAEMGFWDADLNATLLARYNDDIAKVVGELVQ